MLRALTARRMERRLPKPSQSLFRKLFIVILVEFPLEAPAECGGVDAKHGGGAANGLSGGEHFLDVGLFDELEGDEVADLIAVDGGSIMRSGVDEIGGEVFEADQIRI